MIYDQVWIPISWQSIWSSTCQPDWQIAFCSLSEDKHGDDYILSGPAWKLIGSFSVIKVDIIVTIYPLMTKLCQNQ
jgi:hypothetical protein